MMKKKLLTGALSAAMLVTLCVPRTLLTKAETTSPVLVCEKEEHKHSAECYELSGEPTCGLEEAEGHKHNDDCYEIEEELTCTRDEDETHEHGVGCYTTKRTLVCDEEESAGHTHSAKCFEKVLICELEEHKHSNDCYQTETVESEEETEAPETEESTANEETEVPETEESTVAEETSAADETTEAETPENSETEETKETEARECTCGTEDGIHDEDCPLYKKTIKETPSNATTPTTPPAPVTPVHIEGCSDECTGENCNCPCHRMSLLDRVMTCETLEDIWKVLDASTEEDWNALSEEEIAQIDAKIEALEPEPYPAVVIDDTVEDTVQSEIVSLGVNISDVAPFRAPVEGGR